MIPNRYAVITYKYGNATEFSSALKKYYIMLQK